jgi:hypothetical protein
MERVVQVHHAGDVRPRVPGRAEGPGGKGGPSSGAEDLIPLTVPEVRRLFTRLYLRPSAPAEEVLAWSRWRRKHQARARHCHYRTRAKRWGYDVQL